MTEDYVFYHAPDDPDYLYRAWPIALLTCTIMRWDETRKEWVGVFHQREAS